MTQAKNNDINGMDSGSAIPSTSREDLWPAASLSASWSASCFRKVVDLFWSRREQNNSGSRPVAALRDALFPQLLSGEHACKMPLRKRRPSHEAY